MPYSIKRPVLHGKLGETDAKVIQSILFYLRFIVPKSYYLGLGTMVHISIPSFCPPTTNLPIYRHSCQGVLR